MEDKIIPKFNIGDVVSFRNNTSFNPAYKVTTIGTVTAIHLYYGRGMCLGEDLRGTVRYDISGHSQIHMDEACFTLVKGLINN